MVRCSGCRPPPPWSRSASPSAAWCGNSKNARKKADLNVSAHRQDQVKRITPRQITARKGKTPIVALTAYTTPIAEILDEFCDIILVGDSVGTVLHGLPNT
ncbi:MAG: 3-methyl-2-oxobutanoate hydroxymethyltransferase, partial [Caulobacteraceae bacterium]